MSAEGIQKVLDELTKKTKRRLGQERIDKVRAVVAVGPNILTQYIKNELIKVIQKKAKDKKIEPIYDKVAINNAATKIGEILNENIQKKFATADPINFTITKDVSGKYPVITENTTVWSVEPKDGKDYSVFNFLKKHIMAPAKKATFDDNNVKKLLKDLGSKIGSRNLALGHLMNSADAVDRAGQNITKQVGVLNDLADKESNEEDAKKIRDLADNFLERAEIELANTVASIGKVYASNEYEVGFTKFGTQMDTQALRAKAEMVCYMLVQNLDANSAVLAQEEKRLTAAFLEDQKAYLEAEWVKIKGSPTIPEEILDATLVVSTKKFKKSVKDKTPIKTKLKKSRTTNKSEPLQKGKRSVRSVSRPKVRRQKIPNGKGPGDNPRVQDVTENLITMKRIINEHLPEYIEKNMGKGSAKEILNYRTGRFANSAELLTIAQPGRTKTFVLEGVITYLRNPYDVFRPGGRLHKPGRDPKKIINKSIRQILKEKALSALSFRSEVR